MLCCLKRWLWFKLEGRVELALGLEVHLLLDGQGLEQGSAHWELMLGLVELEGLGLDRELVVLELFLAMDLEQEVVDL